MLTGKYAGIGALIRYHQKLKRCVIEEPYEGMPAAEVGLKKGDIIRTNKLEKALRNLRDLPGIGVDAALAPGSQQGTSNLTVKLRHHDIDSYVVYAENYGSRSAGRYRYGAQAEWRNLEGSGSRLNVGGLISNANQHGYNVGFETPVGHSATTVGIGYSYSNYELGNDYRRWGVKGYSHTVSLYGKTPLQNSGANGLNLIYAYNYRKLTDEFNGVNFGDRHSHSFSVGLNGRNRTAETYRCALNSLLRFLPASDIELSRIDAPLMHDYERYLQNRGLQSNSSSLIRRLYIPKQVVLVWKNAVFRCVKRSLQTAKQVVLVCQAACFCLLNPFNLTRIWPFFRRQRTVILSRASSIIVPKEVTPNPIVSDALC